MYKFSARLEEIDPEKVGHIGDFILFTENKSLYVCWLAVLTVASLYEH